MTLTINTGALIIFDLDDTLYKEIDFVHSAYKHISKLIDPINWLYLYEQIQSAELLGSKPLDRAVHLSNQRFTIADILTEYRSHIPDIELSLGVNNFVNLALEHNCSLGLITDGRSLTQRNKLSSLGLATLIHDVVISEEFGSEKPCIDNFLHFDKRRAGRPAFYIGDNVKKDFIAPNWLGWTTICLKDDGRNIHSQNGDWNFEQLPQYYVESFQELLNAFA